SFVHSRSVFDYFKRRILRIYPGFVAAGIISLAFFGWLGMHFSPAYWQKVELGSFLLRLPVLKMFWIPQSFFGNHWPYVNVPIWTIQYEFVCYILIALLGVAGILRFRAFLLILFFPVWLFFDFHIFVVLSLSRWWVLFMGNVPAYY